MALVHVILALVLAVVPQHARTLGIHIEAANLPLPPGATDLDTRITSHAVLDDPKGFLIAYYHLNPENRLRELRIRSFDKRTRAWRAMTRPEPIGSIASVQRGGTVVYVTGHSSPSAAPTLVLTEDLKIRRELDGWQKLVLPDGRLVFSRSMIHFSPTHAEALSLYDPVADRQVPLYPPAAVRNNRGGERIAGTDFWMDRSIPEVKSPKDGTIAFAVVEQRMRLDKTMRAQPAGTERRFRVSCDLSAMLPVCRSR